MLNNSELHIIIQGCVSQDRGSQREFYKFFYGYSAAICMRYSPKKDNLVEIVNDGFLKVFKQIQTFIIPKDHIENTIKAWIRKIMINASIDYYRKYLKDEPAKFDIEEKAEVLEANYLSPLDKISYDELVKLVQELSPMYKMVFNMYVIDGLTHDEIAKELNISANTSKSNLSRARMNIIKLIENKYK